jgi:hypothetical protein
MPCVVDLLLFRPIIVFCCVLCCAVLCCAVLARRLVASGIWYRSTSDHALNKLKAGAKSHRGAKSVPVSSTSALPVKAGGVFDALAQARLPSQQLQRATLAALPCVLIQRPPLLHRGFAAGWDVVVPAAWASTVWLTLIHSGATAVSVLVLSTHSILAGRCPCCASIC